MFDYFIDKNQKYNLNNTLCIVFPTEYRVPGRRGCRGGEAASAWSTTHGLPPAHWTTTAA